MTAGTANAVTIATVPVGNPGNAGELSGGAGGYGPPRICGAVAYDYRIGATEVTAGQYRDFLNSVGGVDTYGLYNTGMSSTTLGSGIARTGGGTVGNPYTYSVASDFMNRPVNYVSYWDSCRFSNWLNNGQPAGAQNASTTEGGSYTLNGYSGGDGRTIQRNPGSKWAVTSEDEWYKGAYYNPATSSYYDYPTSSDTAPGQDMADVSGNNANYYTGSGPYPIDSPYYTTVAGEFQDSDSPYGTFDQGGNVWEWNESVVSDTARGLRGGSFGGYGRGDSYLRASSRDYSDAVGYPSYEHDYLGFRVVQVPEPTTLAVLALGGVGMLARRRGLGR